MKARQRLWRCLQHHRNSRPMPQPANTSVPFFADKYLSESATITTDCNSVLVYLGEGNSTGPKRPFGGLWRQHKNKHAGVKTKAHRCEAEAAADGDLEAFRGNDQADKWAKQSIWGRTADCATQADRGLLINGFKRTLIGAAKVLSVWPGYKEAIKQGLWTAGRKARRQRRAKPLQATHEPVWQPHVNRHVCSKCHHGALTVSNLRKTKCSHSRGLDRMGQLVGKGHKVCRIGKLDGEHIWFCWKCGLYSQSKVHGLFEQCTRKPTDASAKSKRGWLRQGHHPRSKGFVGEVVRVYVTPLPPSHPSSPQHHTWLATMVGLRIGGLRRPGTLVTEKAWGLRTCLTSSALSPGISECLRQAFDP
jgi:hypothetical protein